jgi:uncharacterized protein (DUF1330 family)
MMGACQEARRAAMPVYMIIEIEIRDEKLYAEYVERVREVVVKHGGRYLVRGGQVTPLSGNWNPERIIIIEFETIEHLRRCFGSEEYRELAPLREKSTLGRSIVVEGCRQT